jgi:hypothetical protein
MPREQVARALCGNWMFKPWESIVLAYATADKVLTLTESNKAAAVEAERAACEAVTEYFAKHSGVARNIRNAIAARKAQP